MEHVAYQKIAIFPNDEAGRQLLATFQQSNRIVHISAGEMVNQGKKEPCLWVIYIPGLDPYLEQEMPKKATDGKHTRKGTKA